MAKKIIKKDPHYEIEDLVKRHPDSQYYVIYGERSSGKSFSTLRWFIREIWKEIKKGNYIAFGYIRRWTEDIRMNNMTKVFKSLMDDDNGVNWIDKITNHTYNAVIYKLDPKKGKGFYFVHKDEDGNIDDTYPDPIGYIFSLSEDERIKSTGFPEIKYIFFDEFIARSGDVFMTLEFNRFNSILSTIIRNRDDVKIVMAGNSINRYNLYFEEMGLYKVKTQQPGTIDVYENPVFDESGKPVKDSKGKQKILKIAVEYAEFHDRSIKKSNIYFAYSNKNKMITHGEWEIASYPKLMYRYRPKDILLMYFIIFGDEIFQAEIIATMDIYDNKIIHEDDEIFTGEEMIFTYIHKFTGKIKKPADQYIFQLDQHPLSNYRINPLKPIGGNKTLEFIASFFKDDNVYYQTNMIGDSIHNYLNIAGHVNVR